MPPPGRPLSRQASPSSWVRGGANSGVCEDEPLFHGAPAGARYGLRPDPADQAEPTRCARVSVVVSARSGFVRRASSPAVGEIGRRTVSASFDDLAPHLLVCKTRAKTMTPLRPHGRNHQTWTLLRTPSKRRSCRPSSMALSFTPFPGHASPACVRFVVARPPPGDFPAFPPAARVSSLVVPRRRHAVNCGAWLQLCSLQLPNLPASAAHGDGRRACERVSAALCVGDVHTHHVYARDPTVT